jgi:hypothetical protein
VRRWLIAFAALAAAVVAAIAVLRVMRPPAQDEIDAASRQRLREILHQEQRR